MQMTATAKGKIGGTYGIMALAILLSFSHAGRSQNVIAWGDNFNKQCDVVAGIANPIAVAAGGFHSVVLRVDGSVVAWGKDRYGQTNVPPSATNVKAIAAGRDHSLALRNDGSVVAWGLNADGQTNVPAALSNVVALASGAAHSVALRSDGTVVVWGNNDYGQTNVPTNLTDVIAIASGYYHNLALRSDRSILAWGSQNVVPPSATNVVAIAAGFEHSLALKSDGSVVAWGDNTFGQCTVPASVTNAIAISAGWGHSTAQLSDGHVVVWGMKYAGITNVHAGFINVTNVPIGLSDVASISSGEGFDLALVRSGAPYIRVQDQTITAHVGSDTLLTPLSGGTYPLQFQWYHDGSLISDATNRWLKLANGQTTHTGAYTLVVSNVVGTTTSDAIDLTMSASPYFLTPVPTQRNAVVGTPLCLPVTVSGEQPLSFEWQLNGTNLVDGARISGATSSTLYFNATAYEDSGSLNLVVNNSYGSFTNLVANLVVSPIVTWGDNSSGQLSIPVDATNEISIASGADHSVALRNDGTVVAWGDNSSNQNTVPPMGATVFAVAEGDSHSLALRTNGTVVAWGDNSAGQTNVPAISTAIAVAAGSGISQALLSNGTIVQWGSGTTVTLAATAVMSLSTRGNNSLALQANGRLVQLGKPALVPPSGTNFIAICTAQNASLALRDDGSLIAWGINYNGLTNVPVAATNIVSIAGGDDHFLALRDDGTVIAWGNTNYNQCLVPPAATNIESIFAGSAHNFAVIGKSYRRTAAAGETVVFTTPLNWRLATYQWQFNGSNIPGATNSALALEDVRSTNSGTYRVIVSNAVGSLKSPLMSLNVRQLIFNIPTDNFLTTNGAVQMHLTGSFGVNPVTILASSDLVNWEPVFTNPPTIGPIDFVDTPPTGSQRYYRAVEHP
jgi:alpha-tubulin suppressor-like RCC1 family protein